MPIQLPETSTRPKSGTQRPARVILYNDDWHTFDEVIAQLMKATGCSRSRAARHAAAVHTQGRDLVFQAGLARCQEVARVLRQIRLQVEVDFDD